MLLFSIHLIMNIQLIIAYSTQTKRLHQAYTNHYRKKCGMNGQLRGGEPKMNCDKSKSQQKLGQTIHYSNI